MDGSKITVHQMGGAFAVEGPSCTSSKMSPADTELDLIASTNFLCSVNRPIRLETTYRTAKENTRNLMVRMILEQMIVRNLTTQTVLLLHKQKLVLRMETKCLSQQE